MRALTKARKLGGMISRTCMIMNVPLTGLDIILSLQAKPATSSSPTDVATSMNHARDRTV